MTITAPSSIGVFSMLTRGNSADTWGSGRGWPSPCGRQPSGLGFRGAPLPCSPLHPPGAVTVVKTCGKRTAVEAGPSRTPTLLSSVDVRASARRCRSRRTRAARCTASWKSTRYQEGRRQDGWAEPGWANATVEMENERKYPLQVAGNFHFAPGKSFQQSHVHGK